MNFVAHDKIYDLGYNGGDDLIPDRPKRNYYRQLTTMDNATKLFEIDL